MKKIPYRADAEQGNIDQAQNRKQQLEWFDFLNDLKSNCPELREFYTVSRKLKANVKNFTEIIRRYNTCQGSSVLEPGKDLPSARVDIGIALSLHRANIKFEVNDFRILNFLNGENITNLQFELGIPILINPERNPSNFSFYLEPSVRYSRFSSEFFASNDNRFLVDEYNDFTTSWFGVGLTLAGRYTIPNTAPKISLQAGPRIDFITGGQNALQQEITFIQNGEPVVENSNLDPYGFSTTQINLIFQVNLSDFLLLKKGRIESSIGLIVGNGITGVDQSPGMTNNIVAVNTATSSIFFKTSYFW